MATEAGFLPGFVITFRESLEVALVLGIILGYLAKSKLSKLNSVVYSGLGAGIAASLMAAFLFVSLAGGFEGAAEQIFEGVTMLAGAALMTTMILWVMGQENMAGGIRHDIEAKLSGSYKQGLFFLVFFSVLREGVETVIFLGTVSFSSTRTATLLGALIGIAMAASLGYALFVSSMKLNIRVFFSATNLLLILFAAGLIAQAAHEFSEANVLPPIIEKVWDMNPPLNPDGTYPLMHDEGKIGGALRSFFGYRAAPSLIELMSYVSYLAIVLFLVFRAKGKAQPSRLQGR